MSNEKDTKDLAATALAEAEAAAIEAKESAEAEAAKIVADAKEEAAKIKAEAVEGKVGKPKPDRGMTDGEWRKKPDADMTRVFRVSEGGWKDGLPFSDNIIVINRSKSMQAGSEIGAMTVALSPNSACQYVLLQGAEEYDEKLKSLRRHSEKVGVIEEVNPITINAVWFPQNVLRKKELAVLTARNQAELASL